jgi:hypothetical protein
VVDGIPADFPARYSGVDAQLRIVARGADPKRREEDWALIEFHNPNGIETLDSSITFDFLRPLRRGAPVVALGFACMEPSDDGALDPTPCPLAIVEARMLRQIGRSLLLEVESPHLLSGLSGGPVVVWDAPSAQWVVIGLIHGGGRTTDGFRRVNLQYAVRPPASVLESPRDREPSTTSAP